MITFGQIDIDFLQQVETESSQSLRSCYQCGRCSAGCPAASEMDLLPNQVIRLIQIGWKKKVLSCHTIWLCLSCAICAVRCPRKIEFSAVCDTLCQMAKKEGYAAAEREREIFCKRFLSSIKAHGRVWEVGLLAGYNLLTRKPFNDIDLMPRLLGKGKIHPLPPRQKTKDRCQKTENR